MPSPEVSVVVVVKDDPRVLDCVDGVLDQETDLDVEVVVAVDDDPADDTPELLEKAYADEDRVHVLRTTGNQAQAWNSGARQAQGAVIVRIDSDAKPREGWLDAIAAPVLEGEFEWAAGPVEGVHQDGLVARYFHHRTEAYCRRFEAEDTLRDAVPSWNVAYDRALLEQVGGYDPWLTASEDWDLHRRLDQAGARGTYVEDALIEHHHPETLGVFASKEAWYTTGQYQMVLKYGPRPVLGAFVLPGAYAFTALLLLAGFVVPALAWVGAAVLVAMLAWHAIGGLRESDPAWYLRSLFRPVEAVAGLYGLARGILRYGVSSRSEQGEPEPV